jgi:hypothetical protein
MLYINLDKKIIWDTFWATFSQTHLVTVNQMPEKQMKHKDNLWPRAHDTVWLDIKPEWKRSRCCCILTQVARNGKKKWQKKNGKKKKLQTLFVVFLNGLTFR